MRILFYGTKPYDRIWFEPMAKDYGYEITFLEVQCTKETVFLARGYDAICIFINDTVDAGMIDCLHRDKVKAILLRSAGFNHVDIRAAKGKVKIDARLVPVEAPPLKSSAAPLHGGLRQLSEQSFAVALPPVLRFHKQVLKIYPRSAEEG